jgi:hypothetical protein
VSAASGSFPLPATYFPDFKNLNDPHLTQDFLQQLQDNFEALKLQVGSNADTSAPQPLTALYAVTWGPYTGTAGFTPYYAKKAGIVVMGGAVTINAAFPGAAQTMFTMPAGFRPASTEQFPCIAVGGAGTITPTTGVVIVEVAATGVVTWRLGVTGTGLTNNMAYISLSSISYGAAA